MPPIPLPQNQPQNRFYRGGQLISDFRGVPHNGATHEPEDWVGSTTCCHGCERSKLGMTVLPDGRLLKQVIDHDPEYWLGAQHMGRYGTDTKLLVKMLHAGQRLPVHAHPHVSWAHKHLGVSHGKAEAWFMLTPGEVYLGLKQDVSEVDLLDLVGRQDTETLLNLLHRVPVQPFEIVYVPPGTLHAIGEGILLIEVQEPSDLSILCEWKGFDIDGAEKGHLGLGFPTALTAVNKQGWTSAQLSEHFTRSLSIGSAMPHVASEYFDLQRVQVNGETETFRGFAIIFVGEGMVTLSTIAEQNMALNKGEVLVVPHGDGEFLFQGSGDVVVIRPPVA
ncbi:hypothetical protein FSARC_10067 [Fusarium sarcochroum]|uniref:Mannose-6-phosphate isomerase cupin domain-containing protein n=1 Tax=Fusarium sarcochroum TaxID=1208366 RepID=A0A8H4TQ28_9HYPO|nr:hypothetical protein FSARC_10067 [Fusarium sarcochroum]